MMLETLDMTLLKSEQIRRYTATDPVLCKIMKYVANSWSDTVDAQLKPFWNRKMELCSLEAGCLLWENRVVVPEKLQDRPLQQFQDGHPGIGAVKSTARSTVWGREWIKPQRAQSAAVSAVNSIEGLQRRWKCDHGGTRSDRGQGSISTTPDQWKESGY